jgi:hypothetical protein
MVREGYRFVFDNNHINHYIPINDVDDLFANIKRTENGMHYTPKDYLVSKFGQIEFTPLSRMIRYVVIFDPDIIGVKWRTIKVEEWDVL